MGDCASLSIPAELTAVLENRGTRNEPQKQIIEYRISSVLLEGFYPYCGAEFGNIKDAKGK